ncbi:MAG: dipicolinate synthase subunit B [Clostridia bacterium]|nr:dipicolinate synthase subunit B [Clostridia bacterium]
MIGYAMCGSFCTVEKALNQMRELVKMGNEILPILSENLIKNDTRFGKGSEIVENVRLIAQNEPVTTIAGAEPLGPKIRLEALIIAPCTGNTLAKISSGITDTCVTMAYKAHRRSLRPTIIALASNDALSVGLCNIGSMLQKKNVFFVPMVQDSPTSKPNSLVCDYSQIPRALTYALSGRQILPMFLTE